MEALTSANLVAALLILAAVAIPVGMVIMAYWQDSDSEKTAARRLKRLLSAGNIRTEEAFVPWGHGLNIEAYDHIEGTLWTGRICLSATTSGEMYAECIALEGRSGPNYDNCLYVNRRCLGENQKVSITLADELIVVASPNGKLTVRYITIRTEACALRVV